MAYVYPLSGGLPISDKDLANAWQQAQKVAQQVAQQVAPAQQQQQNQPPPNMTSSLPNLPALPAAAQDYTPLLLLGGGLAAAYFLTKK
jgi:hypothetical protein